MPTPHSTRGFIIARMPFGNTSLIVRCLCEGVGRITLMAKGVNRPKSPFAGMLDLFYLADFSYQPSRGGDIHTLREIKLIEAHLGLRKSYANLVAAQYFAALVEAITETSTPIPEEYQLFGKALAYLSEVEVTWRAVDRFEQRILTFAGIARADHDLPRAFQALHHKVPGLRDDLLKLLATKTPTGSG